MNEFSPFSYGKIVSLKSFTNRENDCKRLKNNLLNKINTMIVSPRRWGKSSLVEKVANDIEKNHKDVRVVMIDLSSLGDREEFLETFAQQILKSSANKFDDLVSLTKEFLRELFLSLVLLMIVFPVLIFLLIGRSWQKMKMKF